MEIRPLFSLENPPVVRSRLLGLGETEAGKIPDAIERVEKHIAQMAETVLLIRLSTSTLKICDSTDITPRRISG
jgi:hypothetical protein